jgi:RNA polymerase sigma-70 factor (ECF subfamily)
LTELADGDRDVLLLYALSGLSYPEISTALNLRLGTVRSRLHRARGHMRDALMASNSDGIEHQIEEELL